MKLPCGVRIVRSLFAGYTASSLAVPSAAGRRGNHHLPECLHCQTAVEPVVVAVPMGGAALQSVFGSGQVCSQIDNPSQLPVCSPTQGARVRAAYEERKA